MRKWINLVEAPDPHGAPHPHYNQASARYAPDLTHREGFATWFEGSKVIGPNGSPLVAFHGSFDQFDQFNLAKSHGFNRLGFWFDIDPKTPEYFAGYEEEFHDGTHGSIMPCVLAIRNPLILDSEYLYRDDSDKLSELQNRYQEAARLWMTSRSDDWGNHVDENGDYLKLSDGSILTPKLYSEITQQYDRAKAAIMPRQGEPSDRIDGFRRLMNLLPQGVNSKASEVDEFRQELEQQGYDGIHLIDTAADFESRGFTSTDWWIAFRPNQIKSIFAKSFTDSDNIME